MYVINELHKQTKTLSHLQGNLENCQRAERVNFAVKFMFC